MEFDSLLVVSLLVLRVSGLTVQVAHMPLKVLASAAFGKKWPWPVQPEPAAHTLSAWQLLNGECLPARRGGTLPSSRRWRWLPPPRPPPHPPNQPAHWKLIPTNKLLSTCQRGGESESSMGGQKKKERKRDVWESQREESKQARINDTQTSFFPLFRGRRRERSDPTEGKKKKKRFTVKIKWWVSKKKKVVERLKSAHHENVYNVRAIMSAETLFGLVFPSA